jgi:hypothetical protein
MNRLRRIATCVCACLAIGAIAASNAAAAKPSLLLVFAGSHKQIAVGTEIEVAMKANVTITTATGTFFCQPLAFPAKVTANGGSTIQLSLGRAKATNLCSGEHGMPFLEHSFQWFAGPFPFSNSFGEIVWKPKGKSDFEGIAELHAAANTTDSFVFIADEPSLTRECDYFYKKLKGTWHDTGSMFLEKGDKMKFASAENEPSCPKTAQIPLTFTLTSLGGGTAIEVEFV